MTVHVVSAIVQTSRIESCASEEAIVPVAPDVEFAFPNNICCPEPWVTIQPVAPLPAISKVSPTIDDAGSANEHAVPALLVI